MASPQIRVVGSNFTTFTYGTPPTPLMWLTDVRDSGVNPIGQGGGGGVPGVDVITPLGADHPLEYATGRVLGGGSLVMTVKETWNMPAWQQLANLAGTDNIIDIFRFQAAQGTPIGAQMIIKPPGSTTWRGWTYSNVTIVQVDTAEHVSLEAMTVGREITAYYTDKKSLNTTATVPMY